MTAYKEFFQNLVATLASQSKRSLDPAGYEPIFYVVFDPSRIVEMQMQIKALEGMLKENGYTVYRFDCFKEIWDLLKKNEDWEETKECDRDDPMNWTDIQLTLTEMVSREDGDSFVERLRLKIREAEEAGQKTVVFVVNLEALHGFMRPGNVEGLLNGSFKRPTVFFYPGKMFGAQGLRFLNFYELDGNYRSKHMPVPEL